MMEQQPIDHSLPHTSPEDSSEDNHSIPIIQIDDNDAADLPISNSPHITCLRLKMERHIGAPVRKVVSTLGRSTSRPFVRSCATRLSPQGVRFTQHARGAFQDFSPSTCTHQYHHCIIHTHHSCILLATSFTHNTLLLTWPRSTERRGCSLYPGARVEF